MFSSPKLKNFKPDLIYIHTTSRNIMKYPEIGDSEHDILELCANTYQHFEQMWIKLADEFHCPIIQNNFEYPCFRLLGNKDATDVHGRVYFTSCLNLEFARYAQKTPDFYINDIHYLSSCYGLTKWADPFYWHMYKYALAVPAIPELAFNISNIIKSIYGRNKKVIALDLDNTLWGGVIGDDGAQGIEIGQETPQGQAYSEFQQYIKQHKEMGVLLAVNSKNDYENALAGLSRQENILKQDDFISIKANWEPKDKNLLEISEELNIGLDAIVFVDDNPAERHLVEAMHKGVAVPEMGSPEQYIQILDRSGFFEATVISEDDIQRNRMYQANRNRLNQAGAFKDYHEYLLSLDMRAIIRPFTNEDLPRIVQLTNKSNQFNLTTKRYQLNELQSALDDPKAITLYGRLEDKFGSNGIVSVVMGHCREEVVHIELWLMSCRVLKRNMEFAMMDVLAETCRERGMKEIRGYYLVTPKNSMVKDFFGAQGFEKIQEDETGNSVWTLDITGGYEKKNHVIQLL